MKPDTQKQRHARVRMLLQQAQSLLTDGATESAEQRAADLISTAAALLSGQWGVLAESIAIDIERELERGKCRTPTCTFPAVQLGGYCAQCAESLAREERERAEAKRPRCKGCGRALGEGRHTCRRCGVFTHPRDHRARRGAP